MSSIVQLIFLSFTLVTTNILAGKLTCVQLAIFYVLEERYNL